MYALNQGDILRSIGNAYFLFERFFLLVISYSIEEEEEEDRNLSNG